MLDWNTAVPRWQGAEARLFVSPFAGAEAIWKVRIPKAYRHPELEKRLTSRRILQEARLMAKAAKAGIPVPSLLFADPAKGLLVMEMIHGRKIKDLIDEPTADLSVIAERIGTLIAQLHNLGVIHGDLTTSNILVCAQEQDFV